MDSLALLGDRVIAYRPILRSLGIASTIAGTLLASQLLWEYQQHGRQAFAITDIELASRTGLSVDELRAARADITGEVAGQPPCFRYRRRGFPSRGYWDVDTATLAARLEGGAHLPELFGPQPEQEPPVRALTRTAGSPAVAPVRAGNRTEQAASDSSQGSSSGHSPRQFGPAPELSIDKNHLEELIPEQSIPLTPRLAPRGTRMQGSNPRARGVNPRAQRVDPATAVLPAALEPHRDAIADFWAAKRRGSAKTAAAFQLLLGQLEQIQAADPSAVVEQLNAATQAGWSSITFQNWQRYGHQSHAPRLAFGGHGSRAQQNAAEAKRLMDSWGVFNEAAAAAPTATAGGALPWH